MNKRISILALLCVSSIAHGQSSHDERAAGKHLPTINSDRMARTAQLIVKLRDTVGVADAAAASAQGNRTAEIDAVIARVQLKRRQDRTLYAYGSAAQSAPGAADDPAANVHVKRVMTRGEHVLQVARPMTGEDAAALAAEFAADPAVAYAEPDFIMVAQRMPANAKYRLQWGFHSGPGGARFDKAWDKTVGSDQEVVAVIDSGVLPHHDLVGRLLPGYDFMSDPVKANHTRGRNPNASDPGDWVTMEELTDQKSILFECSKDQYGRPLPKDSSWHGTHVAGTIGAAQYSATGVSGGTWKGSVLPVRVLGKCGGFSSDIIDGMRWAAGLHVEGVPTNPHAAKVINMSLGGYGGGWYCPRSYQDAIDEVTAHGATVVVAAGNSRQDARLFVPASCEGVITVAAHDENGKKAWFSNFGPAISLSAPGVNIWSTSDMGERRPRIDFHRGQDGTSMAAPHVAAVVSLMRSVNNNLTPAQVKKVLEKSARVFPPNSSCIGRCGAGMLDAEAAVREAERGRVAM